MQVDEIAEYFGVLYAGHIGLCGVSTRSERVLLYQCARIDRVGVIIVQVGIYAVELFSGYISVIRYIPAVFIYIFIL